MRDEKKPVRWAVAFAVVSQIAGCSQSTDELAERYARAVDEREQAFCLCTSGDEARCTTSTEASRCSLDVIAKHSADLEEDTLECLIESEQAVAQCLPNLGCLVPDQHNVVMACTSRVPACDGRPDSVVEAINQETLERCVPLVRCRDGSMPVNGLCRIMVDAGPPPPTCAEVVTDRSAGLADPACAECLCAENAVAVIECDATCWELIACADRECASSGGGSDAGACLTGACSESLSGLTLAADVSRFRRADCARVCAFFRE
jgi:hypothetical protein